MLGFKIVKDIQAAGLASSACVERGFLCRNSGWKCDEMRGMQATTGLRLAQPQRFGLFLPVNEAIGMQKTSKVFSITF